MTTFEEFKQKIHGPKADKMSGDRFYRLERETSARISWFVHKNFPKIRPTHVTVLSLGLLLIVFLLSLNSYYYPWKATSYTLLSLVFLYLISITDKVDGELARATGQTTQRGVHYDRAVHFIYPAIFYFLLGTYFFTVSGSFKILALSMLAAILVQEFLFLTESKLMIAEKIRKNMEFKDLYENKITLLRPAIGWRVLDYLTFMIYAWTLFLAIILVVLSIYYPLLSYDLYFLLIFITVVVNAYKVFVSYPRYKLFTKEEAEKLGN